MRRSDRELKDMADIVAIAKRETVCTVAFHDESCPYLIPLNYGAEVEEGKLVLYFHGAKEGKKLDLLRKDDHVCFEMDYDHEMIPAKYACAYNFRYASVVGRGHCEIITDVDEKIKALELLMKHQTGEDFVMEAKHTLAVEILKITVEEFTGKRRFKK